MTKAIGITSGGLDSILSALILIDQGIDVTWISFTTPFFSSENAVKAAQNHNIPIIVKDITDNYIPLLESPKAGFGKNMNPCMDCHALMFAMAGKEMKKIGADFLFSGEVAGQRPKSQNKNSLRYVEKNSGFEGLILRPLSAKILPETLVEQSGLIDRSKLMGISGRSRKVQMEMAKKFQIKDYPSPAGGCLLTDPGFSRRLKDLLYVQKNYEKRELHLLKYGRHFRVNEKVKVIVGRSKEENENILIHYRPEKDILINPVSIPGPALLIVSGEENVTSKGKMNNFMEISGIICASYTKENPGNLVDVHASFPETKEIFKVCVRHVSDFQKLMV